MAVFTALGALAGAALVGGTTATLIGAGIGLQAAGAYQAAKSAKQQSAFNRDLALTNEIIAQDNARDTVLRGRVAIYDQRRMVAAELGNVRAATAGSGLVVDQAGTTPQDMVADMVAAGELDVMRLKNNIDREERRALVQGAQFEAQANQFEAQRSSISPFRSAAIAGVSGIIGSADILT